LSCIPPISLGEVIASTITPDSDSGGAAAAGEPGDVLDVAPPAVLAGALCFAGVLSDEAAGDEDEVGARAWGSLALEGLRPGMGSLNTAGLWSALHGAALLGLNPSPAWLVEWCGAADAAGAWTVADAGLGVALMLMAEAQWGQSEEEDEALRGCVGSVLWRTKEWMDSG
jgi:hypothetical protein